MVVQTGLAKGAAITSGGPTQTFTDANFGGGNPKAAVVMLCRATADGTAADDAALCVGLTDGTTDFCGVAASEHGQASSDVYSGQGTGRVVYLIDPNTGTVEAEASFSAWTTNGITLNWNTLPSSAYRVAVFLFGGADFDGHVGTATAATTQDTSTDVTAPGFQAESVVTVTNRTTTSTLSVDNSSGGLSIGFSVPAAPENISINWGETHAAATTKVWNHLRTNGINQGLFEGLTFARHELSTNANGFTVTTRDSDGSIVFGYLAMTSGGTASWSAAIYSTPTTTGNDTWTTPGFEPQAALCLPSKVASLNTNEQDFDAGFLGIGAYTVDSGPLTASMTVDDAVGTTNTQSLFDGDELVSTGDTGGVDQQATLVSAQPTGPQFNHSNVDTTLRYWSMLTVEATPMNTLAASLSGSGALATSAESTWHVVASLLGAGALTVFGTGPAASPFVDHFAAAPIASRWTAVDSGSLEAGSGTLTFSDGYLIVDTPSGTDSAFIALRLDPDSSQILQFAIRRVSGTALENLVALWQTSVTPAPDTPANLDGELIVSAGIVNNGTNPTIRFVEKTEDGTKRWWAGEATNAWQASAAEAVDPVREGAGADFYLIAIQWDAENSRVRMLAQHKDTGGPIRSDQGVKWVAITDWRTTPVGLDTNLWLTIGDRTSSTHSGTYHVEYCRLDALNDLYAWSNARDGDSGAGYDIRENRGQNFQLLPEGRGVSLIPFGGVGTWNEDGYRKRHVILIEGTYYMFLEGFDSGGNTELGLYTASNPEGPWTPNGGNPIITDANVGTSGSYNQITAPWIVYDLRETTASRRWKMLVTAQVAGGGATHRMFLLTASAAAGPWTMDAGSGTDGCVLEGSGTGWRADGVGDAVVYYDESSGTFGMYFSGIDTSPDNVWAIGHATSSDLKAWTLTNGGNPVIKADGVEGLKSWTAVSGKTITVTDGTAFDVDACVVIRNASTANDWAIGRIRKIVGNDLELYQELDGITGTDSNRTVSQLGAGSITPHALLEDPSGYRLVVTVFQPFTLGLGAIGNCELTAALTAATRDATSWSWDHLGSPVVAPDIWNGDTNNENVGVVNTFVAAHEAAAAVSGSGTLAVRAESPQEPAASLSGSGALACSLTSQWSGSATLNGSGALAVLATSTASEAAAALSGSGALAVNAITSPYLVRASLAGSGALAVEGLAPQNFVRAVLTGVGRLTIGGALDLVTGRITIRETHAITLKLGG